MSKKVLKNFSLWGREKLKEGLKESFRRSGIYCNEHVLEKCTYIWFMRLVIIRYAEVHNYIENTLELIIRSSNGYCSEVLINGCRQFKKVFPYYFDETIHEFSSILPWGLWQKNSFIDELINSIDTEFFNSVEILGWFHQFYNIQKHESVVGLNNGVIKSEDISAATQLFTPKWIVQYMVDNTLGRIWIEGKGEDSIKSRLTFYIENKHKNEELQNKMRETFGELMPEEIKFFDPACGSGNVLVYAFEVFYHMYESYGYEKSTIPSIIIKNNLFGLDIDNSAVELARAALILKGREVDENFFNKLGSLGLEDNILCIKSSKKLIEFKGELIKGTKDKKEAEVKINALIEEYYYGEIYGSLIEPSNFDKDFWKERLNYIEENTTSKDRSEFKALLRNIVRQSEILTQSYQAVCTNPPYMCKKYMDSRLKSFINKNYRDFNGDLFSVFMVRNFKFTVEYGLLGFMTPFVWMFISEYQELRKFIIYSKSISSLIQLEYSAYEDAIVAVCTFVLGNYSEGCTGEYFKLSDFKGCENQPLKVLQAIRNPEESYRYSCSADMFKAIPGNPIAYWISEELEHIFKTSKRLRDYIDITGSQNVTGDNLKYLRKHWELEEESINKRWKFYTKGGDYRKWYGNMEYLVDWSEEARAFYKNNKTSNLLKEEYCFRKGITYNAITTRGFSAREAGEYIYDKGGPTFHLLDESLKYYILALLNSKVTAAIMQLYNPTMNYQVQDVKNIPVKLTENRELKERIDKLCRECIELSKADWSEKEICYGFREHPLIKYGKQGLSLKEAYLYWEKEIKYRFEVLKSKEEELNKIFIDIYGLNDTIDSSVSDYEITVSRGDLEEGIKSIVSFGVGCISGRYRLNSFKPSKEPLLLSGKDNESEHIVHKFIEFIAAAFGKENLEKNMNFLASALGNENSESSEELLRKYFKREFFKDHYKAFKKRPIYWVFSSGKRMAFSALVYMKNINFNTYHMLLNLVGKNINIKSEELRKINEKISKGLDENFKNSAVRTRKKLELDLKELESYLNLLKISKEKFNYLDLEQGVAANYSKLGELMVKLQQHKKLRRKEYL